MKRPVAGLSPVAVILPSSPCGCILLLVHTASPSEMNCQQMEAESLKGKREAEAGGHRPAGPGRQALHSGPSLCLPHPTVWRDVGLTWLHVFRAAGSRATPVASFRSWLLAGPASPGFCFAKGSREENFTAYRGRYFRSPMPTASRYRLGN